jgi:hypothetical protein
MLHALVTPLHVCVGGAIMATRTAAGMMVVGFVFSCLLGAVPRAAAQVQDSGAIDRAAALRTFTQKVEQYASLRARYEAPLPSFDVRRDPWGLRLQRAYLASAIRTARRYARLGDIFTEPIARMFREDIVRAVYDVAIEGLDEEGFDSTLVDLTVNEPVPVWAMRPVPGAMLERLPPLPGAIEYRLVADALILWDTHAEILIDALPGALVGS